MSGYTPDNAGQSEWLRSSAELRAVLQSKVDRAKGFAETIAPVGDPASDPHPGEYRDSFTSGVRVGKVAKGPDRLIGHVTNEAGHAAAVEYGYSGRSGSPGRNAHHVLTRAIDAMRF